MRNRGRFAWLIATVVLATAVAHDAVAAPAWAADAGVERLRFKRLGVRDGLSQTIATTLAQDARGFVWVGTQDGLNRYDGYGFRVYRHDRDDPASLPDNNVRRLLADSKGRLWIGFATGLARYDAALDRFDTWRPAPGVRNALAARSVGALLEDRDGRIWVATSGGALQFVDERGGFAPGPCDGEPTARINALAQAHDGALLLGTDRGLWRCDVASGALSEIRYGDARIVSGSQTLRVGAHGEIWVAASGQGVFRFDADGTPSLRLDSDAVPPLADRTVHGLAIDRDGAVWFGSDVRGVSRFDPATRALESYGHAVGREYSLASNRAFSLLEDRDGVIWVGSWGSGVSLLDPRTAAFVQLVPGAAPHALPGASATAVLADADGAFWIGTLENGGLSRFDPARGVVERHVHDPARADSLATNFVTGLARGPDGSLWVGTNDSGLDRLAPGAKGFAHYRHDPARADTLPDDDVQGLYVDKSGTLWVSTANGLAALCAGCDAFRRYVNDPNDPASLGGGSVQTVLETRAGELWVGLRRNGLDRLDRATGRFEHFRADLDDARSLANDVVTSLHEDARGDLWIGTQGGGLNRLRRDAAGRVAFDAVTTREGLAADAIGGIAEDAQGRLWLSTTAGISRYDPPTRSVLNLSGARGGSDAGYFIGAASQHADGRVLFGGPAGVTVFDPADVATAPPPQPLFTDFRLFNAPVAPRARDAASPLAATPWTGGGIELDYRQSMFSLDFAAPNAADPDAVRYAYRLDPHDAEWIETDASRRTATYTALPPGDYRLRLRARYAGQAWSGAEAALAVRVKPAPWFAPPALAAYVALAALLGAAGWWRRRERLRRRAAAQEDLRRSEERLKHALWGSGGELWDIDLASGRLHRENRLEHLAASHDATAETVASYMPFLHPDDTGSMREAMIVHLKGASDDFAISFRTRDRSGEWTWLLTRGRVVERDAQGRARRMTGTTHDINALKRAEEALRSLNEELELRVERRTAALRTANVELQQTLDRLTLTQRQLVDAEKLASLGGLVAGIAHEINTPLGVGVTAASHLAEEARRLGRALEGGALARSDLTRFQEMARESSELILRNLQRADGLVRSFKQVAVDQSNEDRRVVELGACLREILTTLGPALRKTPHAVTLACPVPVPCLTAPGALYQILTNLVMNSLTHGYAPGVAGALSIAVARDGDEAVVDYRDDGAGMDEATRSRIFDPFFTTRRGQGGSGLGMHIVYNLVTQALGGTIACRSAPGRGVEFRIRFPHGTGR
ncbi:two-component regulator propeller domain-containing protein [Tahibacter soli]|uniref:histidine kinase n=1 Tax=Tahibacter soli TaxID=2983605 RepID=A0A9X3YLP3_9GAMM|nr:two-component regulator propeller domain-containing protein [Tahibacter soli]MDC8012993.1 two-component regulator propeller domain-containing protein [Tahibacter soli]